VCAREKTGLTLTLTPTLTFIFREKKNTAQGNPGATLNRRKEDRAQLYICIYTHIYLFTHIYIEIKINIDRYRSRSRSRSMIYIYLSIYPSIYLYRYIYLSIYLYICTVCMYLCHTHIRFVLRMIPPGALAPLPRPAAFGIRSRLYI